MMRVGNSRGFTIVETVIFLAVSSGLFVSAMLMMSGQQAKTEFRQAYGETRSQLDDVANDVSTGYYSSPNNVLCARSGSTGLPTFYTQAGQEKGTSSGCIFLGRAVQLGLGGAANTKLAVYTVGGFRLTSSGQPTSTMSAAQATLSPRTDMIDTVTMPGGLTVANAFYQDVAGGPKTQISGFVFASSLAGYSSGNTLKPGANSVDIYPVPGVPNAVQSTFLTDANTTLRTTAGTVKNPGGGVSVCLDSGGTDQHVILRFGLGGSVSSVAEVKGGKSAADGDCTL